MWNAIVVAIIAFAAFVVARFLQGWFGSDAKDKADQDNDARADGGGD